MADELNQPQMPLRLHGKLLLAEPSLRDGVFHKSVVLLTHHTPEEGAAGLVLNHPTGKVVGDFLKGEDFSPLRHLDVHEGGPVLPEQLTFSSFWWTKKRGLHWALRVSVQEAIDHARRPGRIVRAFVGYSGWSAGQLENEMQRGAWFLANPQPALLGHPHDLTLWRDLLREMSPLHRILAEAPENPLFN